MVGVLGIFKARGTKVFNDVIGKASEVGGGSVTSILPIKCLLSANSDIYGSFLLNMALPVDCAASRAHPDSHDPDDALCRA